MVIKILTYIFLLFFGLQIQAKDLCLNYLDAENYVFVLQADNFTARRPFSEVHWSMIEASTLNVDIQKYIPKIIDSVLGLNVLNLDEKLNRLYTFVGTPRIEISFRFESGKEIVTGRLRFIGTVYKNRNERHGYYIKNYGTIEAAYFQSGIQPEDTLPWSTTFYFVGQ